MNTSTGRGLAGGHLLNRVIVAVTGIVSHSRPGIPAARREERAIQRGSATALAKIPMIVGIALLMSGGPVDASVHSITPDDVYQVVGTINGDLEQMHELSILPQSVNGDEPVLTERRPRHVIQKAREVMLKVQLLRRINGLPENDLPALPPREVRLAEVKAVVERIRDDLAALRPVFGVTAAPASLPKPSGKSATDVYAELLRASAQLDRLGIPGIVPNDVYRVARTIIGELEKVRSARGLNAPVRTWSGGRNKQPSDVYAKGFELLRSLQTLTAETPDFAIPGGVVMLNPRSGRIECTHVMDLLNNVLAEISAIKVKVGAPGPTEFAPPQAGKTPSDVYDAITTGLAMVEALG